jgi:hypothetical protein
MRRGERVRSLVAGVLNALGIATIPKRDLTVTRLHVTVARLKAYWQANGQLPPTLADLPAQPRRDNAAVDGWGRPIRYEITGPTTGTLSSPASAASGAAVVLAFDVAADGPARPIAG